MNLYRLGKKIGIGELMNATKFEPNDNWCPPCYSVSSCINYLSDYFVLFNPYLIKIFLAAPWT